MPDFTPTFHDRPAFHVAGIRRWHTLADAPRTIPPQWHEFDQLHLPGRAGNAESFGVTCQLDRPNQRLEYLACYQVMAFDGLPHGLAQMTLPAAHYAVFRLAAVAEIRPLWQYIFTSWLPSSGYRRTSTPDFERYDETFDPVTRGPLEVWFPVTK